MIPSTIQTVIINLENRPERKKVAINELVNHLKFPPDTVHIFKATTPSDRSLLRRKSGSSLMLSGPEKACAVSHIRLWEKWFVAGDDDFVLVFEDDAFCTIGAREFSELLYSVTKNTPKSINFVNLGAKGNGTFSRYRFREQTEQEGKQDQEKRKKKKPVTPSSPPLYATELFSLIRTDCALYHAYLIRRRACKEWALCGWHFPKPIDKVHQDRRLKKQYACLFWKGQRARLRPNPGFGASYVLYGSGVFGQLRGDPHFCSDLAKARQKRQRKKKEKRIFVQSQLEQR